MHFVIGMAKSHLDLKGAKREKLELDFLRLAWAKKCREEEGDTVDAVLVVMTDEIASFCRRLSDKYKAYRAVDVVVAAESGADLNHLAEEKRRNRSGMIKGTLGRDSSEDSVACVGKQLGENRLRQHIEETFAGVKAVRNSPALPGVAWDFCGVLPET